ncbi:metal-sensitive transcriptional regulator [Leptospira bourretii]|uniref:Metal-sensitive transcriptional regulator n=4 Tax=Leptospira TaxID=171 RepID=A0A4R9IN66_9LEPT|nr:MULTISPECIES: metal-sensitive transcriptional regulator [Leptospira]PKA22494.1 metal-sensitive transcriptional repressor [Leptospira sp. mixed culture ATI2-C-A1]EKJ87331.1 metal-sensitive transcriptional repressor [Leptospira meyeri serovar Hardjo str. Went 5]EMJ89548.1 metal-sensitive transcriptional repressor [Leptospira meyeri serovar Semaranga str. Veldrot Semarang 173]MCG6139575.1 metal-sensitive transcriptional regulator [Leptospira mtsangambouensis]MCW7489240.1 metal-sensitive transc
MSLSENQTKLIHRINRIQGQLEAIKNTITTEEKDCEKAILLLKAAHQAMKKFGEAYIHEYMDTCFKEKKSVQNIETDVKKAITAAFSL